MVGKIKHVRQKLHQEAVKYDPSPRSQGPLPGILSHTPPAGLPELHNTKEDPAPPPAPPAAPAAPPPAAPAAPQIKAQISFPSGIFSGTKISTDSLKQTLKFEQPPDVPPETNTKISSIKQSREQEVAAARRRKTPVVGDLRPLPELSHMLTPNKLTANDAKASRRKSRKNSRPMKRTEPTDFSQMKQSQKRRLL